ncbi:N-6 DNA methylase [Paraburkholderia sp. D15]|uniref:class I SAM-dependent DNA methyltransferase n=1 Tax=Paraburkholderia sp. D15 TaxID=2880218 RepID=UPI00247A3845|nr:DNA methyltransferase [Paraburkholderia sp. D15]WGS54403.1 N-6 DNA methylase [Paraburkholderia sp. D15]
MNIAQIEENVRQVLLNSSQEDFIFDLLLAYNKPKASITRLQATGNGTYNLSKVENRVLWKNNLLFIATTKQNLEEQLLEARDEPAVERNKPRFLVATDFNKLFAIDSKTEEELNIAFVELQKHFAFFLPWAGFEKKAQHVADNPADVKAAEKMAKLFDILKVDNPASDPASTHGLNVFLSRLLFCFFAEDTEIFPKDLFSASVQAHTSEDGDDLAEYLQTLFKVLNTADRSRGPAYLREFPYVNGGLFADEHPIPKFSRRSRNILIECGSELNWSEINPDIFGSMIQAVVDVDQRGSMGMHYTSVTNIMKVIEPLFLIDLYEEFERSKNSTKRLNELLIRLAKIRIFDPACGSGNFLIIAYKELRRLEMEIFKQLDELNKQSGLALSGVRLSQFYGIELDDFAHEVALLSLWLAEHQMNLVSLKRFGRTHPTLPLQPSGNVVCGDATVLNWKTVCATDDETETYILGNPPYLGSKKQSAEQKRAIASIFAHSRDYKNLDFIACWFYLAAQYVAGSKAKAGFVTTNSVVQGDQVSLLWPHIFALGIEIDFAHQSFKWGNNAKNTAGVSCAIVGLRDQSKQPKWIYLQDRRLPAKNIGPYLTDASNAIIAKCNRVLSDIPEMVYGNMPLDKGYLKLERDEKDALLKDYPSAQKFIRKLTGGNEFLYNMEKWCLWIEDDQLKDALNIPPIAERVALVRQFRLEGGDVARTLVNRSHQFRYRHTAKSSFMLVPCTSSERRDYLQVGFYDSTHIAIHSAQVIYDSDPYIFGVVSSRLHMLWTKATCGTLDSRIRYSNVIAYNNFPFPEIPDAVREKIRKCVFKILAIRENYPEMVIANLYDPTLMPVPLLQAHREMDELVEGCYQNKPFQNDEERLKALFKLYEHMTENEVAQYR